jgi:restriction system protein
MRAAIGLRRLSPGWSHLSEYRFTVLFPSEQLKGEVMARRRGFFAEMNYQAQQAEKRRRQEQAQAVRAHNAAVREYERAQKAAERARVAAARATEAERKAAEKEAARLHVESRTAEVEALNMDLAASYADIDGLLEWTLDTDDYVDLESLKVTPEHPPFEPGKIGEPLPQVPQLVYPPQPAYQEPIAPKGLSGAFGGKKKHAEAVAAARAEHRRQIQLWDESNKRKHAEHIAAVAARETDEAERLLKLAEAEAAYQVECAQREAEAAAKNEELTKFINDLAFDVEYAIEDYVGVVLSNSVYPDAFPVEHDYSFDLASRELTLTVNVPEPSAVPAIKEYRYVKAKDEITATQQSAKAQKDRYTAAVHQVAVRTLHEVFEADRAGKIHSIALTLGVNRIAPATGKPEHVPLAVVAADRETFTSFDLANVVPAATLEHLGAALSKSPFDLTPADTSRGVRQRGQ